MDGRLPLHDSELAKIHRICRFPALLRIGGHKINDAAIPQIDGGIRIEFHSGSGFKIIIS